MIAELIMQRFEIYDGRDISRCRLAINDNTVLLNTEFIPLPFSASGKLNGISAIALQESGSPWFYDLREMLEAAQCNPHFDISKQLREKIRLFAGKGASAVIFYNSSKLDDGIVFDPAEGIADGKNTCLICYQSRQEKISQRYFPVTRCGTGCCRWMKKSGGDIM